MKKTIIPSLIAKNQKELEKRFQKAKSQRTLQLDIMDGNFVKNKSLWFNFIPPKRRKYEAHLMVKNPVQWVKRNHSKTNTIIFHIEPLKKEKEINELIELIKDQKKKVGIALNPKTKIEKIKPFMEKIDMVLIMTVVPGKYGSRFLPETLKKVKAIRKLNKKIDIEVDGGIDEKTISRAAKAGANKFVVGSYIQNSEKPKKAIKELKRILKKS